MLKKLKKKSTGKINKKKKILHWGAVIILLWQNTRQRLLQEGEGCVGWQFKGVVHHSNEAKEVQAVSHCVHGQEAERDESDAHPAFYFHLIQISEPRLSLCTLRVS